MSHRRAARLSAASAAGIGVMHDVLIVTVKALPPGRSAESTCKRADDAASDRDLVAARPSATGTTTQSLPASGPSLLTSRRRSAGNRSTLDDFSHDGTCGTSLNCTVMSACASIGWRVVKRSRKIVAPDRTVCSISRSALRLLIRRSKRLAPPTAGSKASFLNSARTRLVRHRSAAGRQTCGPLSSSARSRALRRCGMQPRHGGRRCRQCSCPPLVRSRYRRRRTEHQAGSRAGGRSTTCQHPSCR